LMSRCENIAPVMYGQKYLMFRLDHAHSNRYATQTTSENKKFNVDNKMLLCRIEIKSTMEIIRSDYAHNHGEQQMMIENTIDVYFT